MIIRRLALIVVAFLIVGCNSDELDVDTVTVAIPQIISKAELRSLVSIENPKPITQAGKVYAYKNLIFINDNFQGVHIIDNANPLNPIAISFIKIPGNEDISVKDDFLFADSATDLVVFDISDVNRINLVERLEDVFTYYNYNIPAEAEFTDWQNVNFDNDIIMGWDLEQKPKSEYEYLNDTRFEVDALSESVGQGGSLARFQIVDDYLYTVGPDVMSIFNISNLSQPSFDNQLYAGWNIETMFYADDYLYLGGSNGMYIYGLEDRSAPNYVSEFLHWEGCDPVVVDGDYAYLTLRGGNDCGQLESVLEVIDISDKANPVLIDRYTLENPYGLGYRNDNLFVCDGDAGLKIFNKSNPSQIEYLKDFKEVFARDVIPLNDILLMLGDDAIYQYRYENQDLELLSTFSLN